MNKAIEKYEDQRLDAIIEALSSERAEVMSSKSPQEAGRLAWIDRLQEEATRNFSASFKLEAKLSSKLVKQINAQELALAELVSWQRLLIESGRTEGVLGFFSEGGND